MTTSKYIVDIIGDIVTTMRGNGATPYYLYGHPLEVVNTLTEWTKHPVKKFAKFPIIILMQDFEERKGVEQGVNSSVSLNLVICMNTKPEYKSADRYVNTFKPVLYPLYDSFIDTIITSGYFKNVSHGVVQHTKIDRVFYGNEGNTANQFNDRIDAIEIRNLELDILNNFKNC